MEKIRCPQDIIRLTEKFGFLPFFRNSVRGLSVEEHTPPELWFGSEDGPWEFKGPCARSKSVVYGKFFGGKAAFISLDIFPDFANFRRDGYDFDSRYDMGMASRKDLNVYDAVSRYGDILSKKLKSVCGFTKSGGEKGFDGIITRLQTETYICISDFEYMIDKHGRQYGWGVARYSTPEALFGYDFVTSEYKTEPEISRERVIKRLSKAIPDVSEGAISKIVGQVIR